MLSWGLAGWEVDGWMGVVGRYGGFGREAVERLVSGWVGRLVDDPEVGGGHL